MKELLKCAAGLILGGLMIAGIAYSCYQLVFPDTLEPQVNKVVRDVNVTMLCDTTRFCNSTCENYFSAVVTDTAKIEKLNLRCYSCGNSWGRHKSSYDWYAATTPYQD